MKAKVTVVAHPSHNKAHLSLVLPKYLQEEPKQVIDIEALIEKANGLINEGEYEAVYKLILPHAELGAPRAINYLGYLYESGYHVPQHPLF